MRVLGAVLAGGRSSRFGSDKALALFEGVPLIERALAVLRPLVAELVVCGREHDGIRSLSDRPSPDLGPLGGLNAALHVAASEGFDGVLTIPCDAPLLGRAALRLLLTDPPRPAVAATSPTCGFWPSGLACDLDAHIRQSPKRSMHGWAKRAGAVAVDLGAIANVNTPDALTALHYRTSVYP